MGDEKNGRALIAAFVVLGLLVMGGIYAAGRSMGAEDERARAESAAAVEQAPEAPSDPPETFGRIGCVGPNCGIHPGVIRCRFGIAPEELKDCAGEVAEIETGENTTVFQSVDIEEVLGYPVMLNYLFKGEVLTSVMLMTNSVMSNEADFPYYSKIFDDISKRFDKMLGLETCDSNDSCKSVDLDEPNALSDAVDRFKSGQSVVIAWSHPSVNITMELKPKQPFMRRKETLSPAPIEIRVLYMAPN